MNKKNMNLVDLLNNKEPLIEQAIKEFNLIARLTKAKYDALVAEGFTPEQAIELCKRL